MAENSCRLVILVQPQETFHFRTIKDLNHAKLSGVNDNAITVKLEGFTGHLDDVTVVCTIYQPDGEYQMYSHPNLLIKLEGNRRNQKKFLDPIQSDLNDDWTVTFPGMIIVRTRRSDLLNTLTSKINRIRAYKPNFMNKIDIRNVDHHIFDMNNLRLCFEAFIKNGGDFVPICDTVFSNNIASYTSQRHDFVWICLNCRGRVSGNEDFIILCQYSRENLSKRDIKVRFFESRNDNTVWEADAIIKYIPFCSHSLIITTPPYENVNITDDRRVFFELYANTDEGRITSNVKEFIYKPLHRLQRL